MLCSVETVWAKLSSLVGLQSASPSAQDLHWAEQWYLSNITSWLLCRFSWWGGWDGAVTVGVVRIRDFRSAVTCAHAHLPPASSLGYWRSS